VRIPDWPAGTVTLLAVTGADGAPGVIPVSTALRAGDARVLLALGRRRATLAALRARPGCALAVLAQDDVAVTLHGAAAVLAEGPPGAEGIAVVELTVDRVQDHGTPRFTVDAGVAWSWADAAAQERDAAVRAVLRGFAGH
jgi:flavin reductase (DIM6/NTAB) family NADH-FMN oxidoreductase RutF